MHADSVLLTQDGTNMAKQNNPKPKQRAVGGLAGLSKARAEADKRIKAMTPTQRKAYQAQNKKNAVKAVATAASFIPAGRAIKGASMAKKAVSTSIKKSVEKKSLKAANAPTKNPGASDSGRRYMGQKYIDISFPSPGRFVTKPNVKKLKEATTPRTKGGTINLNPKFVKDLRKGR